jgi:hypothetical protein
MHIQIKACFWRAEYLNGIVVVVLPPRKQGKSGTRPRRSLTQPTYRVSTGEGSYSFLIPFDSIVPEVCRRRSSNALKKTRSRDMSSE